MPRKTRVITSQTESERGVGTHDGVCYDIEGDPATGWRSKVDDAEANDGGLRGNTGFAVRS